MTTINQFVKRIVRLRGLQKEYFKTRKEPVLARCKQGEYFVRRDADDLITQAKTAILAKAVLGMLDAQRYYYNERTTAALRSAKVAEQIVDKMLPEFEQQIERLEAWGREAVKRD